MMKRIRKNFGNIPKIIGIPDLIGMQRESYRRFLQADVSPESRESEGLQGVFRSVFPIRDFTGSASLEYVSYRFEKAKHGTEECIHRGMTYELPVKITVRLVVYDTDKATGASNIRDIKEQEIYFGAIPLMTERGTFIINGTERVIVSQLHRSSGVFFNHDKGKNHTSGKVIYSARIIPVRGSWIDMEADPKDIIHIKIDKRRKFPVTLLFKACGYTVSDILAFFHKRRVLHIHPQPVPETGNGQGQVTYSEDFHEAFFKNRRAAGDVTNPATGEIIVSQGRKFTHRAIRQIRAAGLRTVLAGAADIRGGVLMADVVDPQTGRILARANDVVDEDILDTFIQGRVTRLELTHIAPGESGAIHKTLIMDKAGSKEDALLDIYRRMRPGNPATSEVAQDFIDQTFFRSIYYDLSPVGRMKLNLRLGTTAPLTLRTLRREDILLTAKTLVTLRDTQGVVDDIDHLGNRRVRAVGELLENQYRIGLVRMERAIRERMSLQEVEALMPNDLINPKPVTAILKEFFGTSQLSQFMDQTNPLSETTHKRRLSALGPGGLTRERAGFEVRDVHPSHYGRICPIETPEGPNIGLIVSLSTYARVNRYGFIETPYRVVERQLLSTGKGPETSSGSQEGDTPHECNIVTDKVVFLSAFEEKEHPIAQANAPLVPVGEGRAAGTDSRSPLPAPSPLCFQNPLVTSRVLGELMMCRQEEIEYMDISPNQLVSVSASLIPFLENDDANRALMGSNMQRQAVPLIRSDAPLVGTGVEEVVAKDSGAAISAPCDGQIVEVEASRIVIRPDAGKGRGARGKDKGRASPIAHEGSSLLLSPDHDRLVSVISLSKFIRSNQNTCINQRPLVQKGQRIRTGQVIADGPATEQGELALGRNITVAFMPWGGYNFEDSILISENLVRDGVYTSMHIEEFEVVARDTKLGKEDITRDIPNVGEEALRDLDESGIIRLGAEVGAGSVLVGKVTPKGETQLSPEEKLLRAIFGEKAGDVKDSSLRIPPGVEGIVIDAKVFSRRGIEKDERARTIEDQEIAALEKDRDDEIKVLEDILRAGLRQIAQQTPDPPRLRKSLSFTSLMTNRKTTLEKGHAIRDPGIFDLIPATQLERVGFVAPGHNTDTRALISLFKKQVRLCRENFSRRAERYEKGDDLPPGVNKLVKVYVAMKRKLSVGDKMAGRHGNKGVVSRILPREDMPWFEDGTPVDMVLNPLGVPSRMNVGQILEVHLGLAARGLGKTLAAMVGAFRRNREQAISEPDVEPDVAMPYAEARFPDHAEDRDAPRQVLRECLCQIFAPEDREQIENLGPGPLADFATLYSDGVRMATPVFDGAKEEEIKALLIQAGLSPTAQTMLYDGRTGEPFMEPVTVGVMYMLKLHHLVDDKIHARSIGPYSLVTQQPLGGKAQFGGQRLGEMEVWAMEAYGAAHSLQEFLTVKSDDMAGRTRMYEKIVKGQNVLEPGLPESFNVLTKELQSLGLEISLIEKDEK